MPENKKKEAKKVSLLGLRTFSVFFWIFVFLLGIFFFLTFFAAAAASPWKYVVNHFDILCAYNLGKGWCFLRFVTLLKFHFSFTLLFLHLLTCFLFFFFVDFVVVWEIGKWGKWEPTHIQNTQTHSHINIMYSRTFLTHKKKKLKELNGRSLVKIRGKICTQNIYSTYVYIYIYIIFLFSFFYYDDDNNGVECGAQK